MLRVDVCRPDHLFFCAWGIAVLGYTLAFALPSPGVLLLILLFAGSFWFGSVSAYLIPIVRQEQLVDKCPRGLNAAVWILSLVSLYYSFSVLSYIFSSGVGLLALAEIRQAALSGEPVIEFGNLLITALQMNFCLALLGYIHERKSSLNLKAVGEMKIGAAHQRKARWFLICAELTLVMSLLDGSRSFLLMGGICLVITQLVIGVYKVRMAGMFFAAFVTVFSVTFPIVRPEVESAFDGFRYTMVYFSGGIGSLDYALNGDVRVYWQDFESIANKLGALIPSAGGYDLSTLRMDMVSIGNGLQTNVFTSLGVYNEYLGWPFALILAFVAGSALALLGRLARRRSAYLFVYAFYAAATVLSLFHEYYLGTTYLLLKVGIVTLLIAALGIPLRWLRTGLRTACAFRPAA